jgi:hypothetical protein
MVTDNKFVASLKSRIPRNPHIFNGFGHILMAIRITPPPFYRLPDYTPIFIVYRNREGVYDPLIQACEGIFDFS